MDKKTLEYHERMAKKYPDVYGVPGVDDVVMIPVMTMDELAKIPGTPLSECIEYAKKMLIEITDCSGKKISLELIGSELVHTDGDKTLNFEPDMELWDQFWETMNVNNYWS